MALSDYLSDVATGYDRSQPMSSPTRLSSAARRSTFASTLRPGVELMGSRGRGVATLSPWIAFLHPDETTTPQEGVYVVHIFSPDLRRVILTLNQGVTHLTRELGQRAGRSRPAAGAAAVRQAVPPGRLQGYEATMAPGISQSLQLAYESGNIADIPYGVATLPFEGALRADLARTLELYQETVALRRELLQRSPGVVSPSHESRSGFGHDPLERFAPKNDSDYTGHIVGRTLTKSRRHEALIRRYGEWSADRGFRPSTSSHPTDLVLVRPGEHWLVEGKVDYRGNATQAVRAALGQLFTYRHLLYPKQEAPGLVALFTEPRRRRLRPVVGALRGHQCLGGRWKLAGPAPAPVFPAAVSRNRQQHRGGHWRPGS